MEWLRYGAETGRELLEGESERAFLLFSRSFLASTRISAHIANHNISRVFSILR